MKEVRVRLRLFDWSLPLLLILLLAAPATLLAQGITGTVTDRETGAPVATAMVVLLDDSGERLLWVVTDREGAFRLRAPAPGTYRLRVDRIGLRSETLEGVRVGEGETLSVQVEVGSRAIELPAVRVEAQRLCRIPDREGLLISDLWDEARKALELSSVTRDHRALHVRGQDREQTRDLVTLQVLDERLRSWAGISRSPYFGAPAEELARDGYVREGPRGHEYFGLAPETILSRSFEETHCFRVRPPGRGQPASEIGLAFEPAPGRTTPDVSGVLWLDRETARLLRVEYVFTRHLHPVALPEEPFGGRTDFGWLEDGTVIVENWWLRMPQFERIVSTDDLPRGAVVRGGVWAERDRRLQLRRVGLNVLEVGGTVTSVALPGRGATGTVVLEGMVHDSIRDAPLARALVYVMGTRHHATTDGDGRFRLAGLPSGTLEVSWQHPFLDELGVSSEPVTVLASGQDTVRVALATPSPSTVFGSRCDGRTPWGWGWVRTGPDDRPVLGAVVVAEWEQQRRLGERESVDDRVRRATVSDRTGSWVICDLRPGVPIRVSAETGGAIRRAVLRVEPGRGGRADFTFEPVAEGAAERGRVALGLIRGQVVREPEGEPVPGVTLHLLADAGEEVSRVLSDEVGGFALPVGSGSAYRIRGTRIGHAELLTERFTMETGDTLDVLLRMGPQPITLSEIEVVARARPPRAGRVAGFYERAERGFGTFLTRDDIERRGPVRLVHMLAEHGMEVTPVGGSAFTLGIVNRRTNCAPMVYVDGIRMTHRQRRGGAGAIGEAGEAVGLVDPLDVEGVEIYRGGATVPGEFGGSTAQCGVILIWTRTGS
jgi:hypothetical protein